MREKHILKNQIQTPDGTILVSRHRHDYRSHTDAVSGEYYMVDGGNEYLRRSANIVPYKELTVYSTHSHNLIREMFEWSSCGKEGDEPLHYILLKDMGIFHILHILYTQFNLKPYIKGILVDELLVRGVYKDN